MPIITLKTMGRVPLPPGVSERCQMFHGHFLRFREAFLPTKGETYKIIADGWDAEQSESEGESVVGGWR